MSEKCDICFRGCTLEEGRNGYCKVRTIKDGKNVSRSYGLISSAALDPIEKKPLALFEPGSYILSVGSYGCNLSCPFCQNHEISQNDLYSSCERVSAQELVRQALRLKAYDNIGIAFTYNEPLINYEFIRDTFELCKEHDLKTVLITSGAVNDCVLDEVLPLTDAWNIDLKSFTEKGYKDLKGDLESVKNCIVRASRVSHVEITTLVVPGRNDSAKEMEEEAKWIASINPDIPLHITRYFPRWKEKEEPTDIDKLKELEGIAKKYLNHVFLGNI